MYTALRAASRTLVDYVEACLQEDPSLGQLFDSGAGGSMIVSLNTPEEMERTSDQGLSLWLYRIMRDEQLLNRPPERPAPDRLLRQPLPFRLHYLVTPIIASDEEGSAETEQEVLGKVLQVFHDHPVLSGTDLKGDFMGTSYRVHVRLETLSLEELTRIYDALDRSYQLSVSYEVSVVNIASSRQPAASQPVETVLSEYSQIVSS